MAYDAQLAERVQRLLARRKGITEKKMFGGLAFMLHGKMFCGVLKDDLVVRVGPERYEQALSRARAPEGFYRPAAKGLCIRRSGRIKDGQDAWEVDRGRRRVRADSGRKVTRVASHASAEIPF
jgi:hypothetical protein